MIGLQDPSAADRGSAVKEGKEGEVVVVVVELESHISIAPNAVIEASRIGTGTEVCVGAHIGQGAVVGKVSPIYPSPLPSLPLFPSFPPSHPKKI